MVQQSSDPTLQLSMLMSRVQALESFQMQMGQRFLIFNPSSVFAPLGQQSAQKLQGIISVGGANTPGYINAIDSDNTILGWIGSQIVGIVQYLGIWFKSYRVGGTDASAPAYILDGIGSPTEFLSRIGWAVPTGGSGSAFWVSEVPTGALDGMNTDFDVSNTPATPDAFFVMLNGVVQNPFASPGYSLAGTTITFDVAPISTDQLWVSYIKA